MRKTIADFPEIAAEFHPTKNGNITPDMVAAGSNKKYWWLRKKCGHEWEANCYNRTSKGKTGCPYCAGKLVCKENSLPTLFPEIAAEFHPTKNGNITAEQVIAGSRKKYWWLGKCGHEWEAVCHQRTGKKNGCPYCAGKLVCKENSLATLFPEIAAEWHPTKNGDTTPDMVVAGSSKKYWWLGKKCGHEWEASCHQRIGKKSGCPYCANHKVCKENSLQTLFPEIAAEWHPTKNGDTTPDVVVAGSHKKYWWLGKKCGHEWEASCGSRTSKVKSGCPYCANHKVCKENSLQTLFPEIAAEWHPTKNGNIIPEQVIAGSDKKYWWLGKCGHEWEAACSSRTSSQSGCPICNESKGENAIAKYLQKKSIKFKREYKFKTSNIARARFDFAIKLGLLIEFHGEQHYLPICFGSKGEYAKIRNLTKNIINDQKKELWCREHNMSLLIIPYWDLDRIEEILDAYFAGRVPVISPEPEEVKKYEPMRQKIIERLKNSEV